MTQDHPLHPSCIQYLPFHDSSRVTCVLDYVRVYIPPWNKDFTPLRVRADLASAGAGRLLQSFQQRAACRVYVVA